jgi:hypothetical protein
VEFDNDERQKIIKINAAQWICLVTRWGRIEYIKKKTAVAGVVSPGQKNQKKRATVFFFFFLGFF